jgi:hypothetical protein
MRSLRLVLLLSMLEQKHSAAQPRCVPTVSTTCPACLASRLAQSVVRPGTRTHLPVEIYCSTVVTISRAWRLAGKGSGVEWLFDGLADPFPEESWKPQAFTLLSLLHLPDSSIQLILRNCSCRHYSSPVSSMQPNSCFPYPFSLLLFRADSHAREVHHGR